MKRFWIYPIVSLMLLFAIGCSDEGEMQLPTAESGVSIPAAPAAHDTTNFTVPIDLDVFIPCALGGVGEIAQMSGNLHVLFLSTADGNGGFHFKFHFQPQDVSGVGLTSGDKYQGTGVTQGQTFTGNGGLPFSDTFVNNFRIIGQGPGNNFLVHDTIHVTVNANGQVTANIVNSSVDCK